MPRARIVAGLSHLDAPPRRRARSLAAALLAFRSPITQPMDSKMRSLTHRRPCRTLLHLALASLMLVLMGCEEDSAAFFAPLPPAGDAGTGGSQDTGGDGDASSFDGAVSVVYASSDVPELRGFADGLIEERIFDPVGLFVEETFLLPEDLTINFADCGVANAFYSPSDRAVIMCYELFQAIALTFSTVETATDEEKARASVSTYLWVLFHELGHALVDILDLPVVGQEEDAVDAFATVLFHLFK